MPFQSLVIELLEIARVDWLHVCMHVCTFHEERGIISNEDFVYQVLTDISRK